ncbi:SPFH domain-containing protein [uncultured Pseudokineococcus sp.]|uniref:SPFH domain-containing protein n=1 Tax=uncultured Pseudokineococcus sp. TaxID=1642928 RepID=UPI002607B1A5|nr:SPFH domain-containing protein [uncultured Pseudokineococcus sp.]
MRVVVHAWEQVLRYRDGALVEVLGPGAHRRSRWRTRYERVDTRPRSVVLSAQEVATAEGLSVRCSLVADVAVVDPRRWVEEVQDADDAVHVALQLGLREAVTRRGYEDLLAARGGLGEEVRDLVAAPLAEVGAACRRAALRDLAAPAEVRQAAAEVVTARALGLASLERARSEVAATRALANAARLVAGSPGLLELRTLQAVEASGGTVVLQGAGARGEAPAR